VKDTYGSVSNTMDHLANSHTQTNQSPDVIRNPKGMYSQSLLAGDVGDSVPMERIITQSKGSKEMIGGIDYFEAHTVDQRLRQGQYLATDIDHKKDQSLR
jgi:hypothetical protein